MTQTAQPDPLVTKVRTVHTEIDGYVIEANEVTKGIILALIAKVHVLALSPPGRAKSLLMRLVQQAVSGSTFFEYTLNGQTKTDEVFGPPKISALKLDRLERPDTGYLQHAHFAFVDEVFKANSSVLHGLLSIQQERVFKDGDRLLRVPLEVMLSASNELPKEEGLEAVFDRYLLRYSMEYIQEDGNFLRMLETPDAPVMKNTLTLDELHDIQKQAAAVKLTPAVAQALVKIRKDLRGKGVIASDRRWKQSVRVIRANAWLRGRDATTEDDLYVLCDILWTTPEQRDNVVEVVSETANPFQRKADQLMDAAYSALGELDRTEDDKKTQVAVETLAKMNKAEKELTKLQEQMVKDGRDATRVEEYLKKIREARTEKLRKGILRLE